MTSLIKVLEREIEELKKSLYNSKNRLEIHNIIEEKKRRLNELKSKNL